MRCFLDMLSACKEKKSADPAVPNFVGYKENRKIMKTAGAVFSLILLMLVYPSRALPDDKQQSTLKPQFFCGYCHILTYPNVMKKAHALWKKGKHKDVPCAQCHYPPDKYGIKIPEHERIPRDERGESKRKTEIEFMKTELEVLSRLVTNLNMEESTVVRKSKIDDRSCTTSKCHPTTGKSEKAAYWTKKLKYGEYEREDKSKGIISFVHEKHYDKEKWIKGDVLHCSSCHYRQTENNHFEVSKDSCILCHLGNNKFNEGLSKCSLCHEIPTKPLQKQKKKKDETSKEKEEEPITHKKLEDKKVSCASCHAEVIKGTGQVHKSTCLTCHDNEKPIMKEIGNLAVMHKAHVADQNARCFECHESIQHKRVDDYFKSTVENCTACHENSHFFQRKLLSGDAVKDVETTPGLMHDAKTNCLGCHIKVVHNDRGQQVKRAVAKACVDCHTERHEEMLKEWKDKIKEELGAVEKVEKEAMQAIEQAKGKVPENKYQKAHEMFSQGKQYLNIVRYGNGAHNKKYSIMLIDKAFNRFEDIIADLSEGGKSK